MAIDTSQLTIQVKSDGIAPAATGLEAIAVAGGRAEAGALKATASLAMLSEATKGLSKSASNQILQQQKTIDLFGQSKEYAGAYSATLKGASDAQVALSGSLGATIDAQKASTIANRAAELQALSLAKANAVLAESEGAVSTRLRKVAEDGVARTAAQRAEHDAEASAIPIATRSGGSHKGGYATATAQTPAIDQSEKAAKAAAIEEEALAKLEAKYMSFLPVLDKYGSQLIKLDEIRDVVKSNYANKLIDVGTFNKDIATLDASKVSILAKELKATEAAAHAAGAGMGEFSMASSRAKSEVIVMIRELLRGDFTRLAGSISIFTQATGQMGTAMAIVLNPITWVGVTLAALAVASVLGAKEFNDFNKTLIVTGNYANLTASQFGGLTKELGMIGSEGQHAAAEALNEIASSGKFTGVQLEEVGRAAIKMQEATGQAVQATAKEFEKLSGDPVRASLELNDKYHYLTVSVYEQINALVEQGKTSEAVTAAMHAYADAIDQRTPKEIESIGLLQSAWEKAKTAAVGYWNAALDVGRPKTSLEQIAALQVQIDRNTTNSKNRLGGSGGIDKATQVQNDALQKEIELIGRKTDRETGYAQAVELTAQASAKGVNAASQIDARMNSIDKETKLQGLLNKEKQRFIDLNNAPGKKSSDLDGVTFGTDKNGMPTVSGGKYDQLVKDDTESVMGRGRKPRTNEFGISAALKEQAGLMQEAKQNLQQDLSETKNLYDIGEQTQKEYLASVLMLKETELAQELVIANKQLEIAGGKKNLTAQKAYANTVAGIYRSMEGDAKAFNQGVAKVDADALSNDKAYTDKLTRSAQLRQDEIDNTLRSASVGPTQAAQFSLLLKQQKDYDSQLAALNASHDKTKPGAITDEQYTSRLAELDKFHQEAIAREEKAVDDLKAVDAQWETGFAKALDTYQSTASNVAAQSATAFTNAFSGMENALVTFATTGKISFSGLVTSIIADIARMQAKAATSQLLGLITSFAGSYFGSGATADNITQSAPASTQVYSQASGYAKGGAFSDGMEKFADGGSFSNGIVDKPTNFNMGLMGEAGPEAIVPLTRTSDGSLGVKQTGGGGSSGDVNANTVINISSSGGVSSQTSAAGANSTQQQFAAAISNATQAEIAKQMRQGGLLWKMKNNQTGT